MKTIYSLFVTITLFTLSSSSFSTYTVMYDAEELANKCQSIKKPNDNTATEIDNIHVTACVSFIQGIIE